MLEITNLVTPSPEDFEVTIKGMRLPMKSGERSDSFIDELEPNMFENCYNCDLANEEPKFILGEKDKQLLLNLCKAGDPSHRKVLRQLPVKCFITAPLYWWKQADKYQIGTVTNAQSTMHTITKYPFKIEDFSFEALDKVNEQTENGTYANLFKWYQVDELNYMREQYLKAKAKKDYEEKNKWEQAMFAWLSESYNQTRCWSGNYEVLVNIINQRSGHKLNEWATFIDYMLENVPYLKEIVEAINETND